MSSTAKCSNCDRCAFIFNLNETIAYSTTFYIKTRKNHFESDKMNRQKCSRSFYNDNEWNGHERKSPNTLEK